MADWSMLDREWPPDLSIDNYSYGLNLYYQEKQSMSEYLPPHAQQYQPLPPPPPSPTVTLLLSPSQLPPAPCASAFNEYAVVPKPDNPREIRNKAEKQRRDKLNHSIAELASLVPPVVATNRKIDKTGILRLTAHYLRAHQYVFGESIGRFPREFRSESARAVLGLLNGFLLTTTYRGLIVVVSQNVQNHLGYTELDLLGQNIFSIIHVEDQQTLKDNLMPKSYMLGSNGELLVPDEPDGVQKVCEALAREKRQFVIRFRKHTQRSEPIQYVRCVVEGSLRKSDRACRGLTRCCPVRRARARGDNPCASGNDVVFIGVVRPIAETFMTESSLESFRMEYRTRHSIDGQIMDCEQRIALATGYMTHEVYGVNAMNFMHRDDVRWVIIALREMYDQHRLVGESCYRLMTKSGQFIYMRTCGQLDVDEDSRAVRSFVCTNTVVEEAEGKHLIKMMKKKFMLMINNIDEAPPEEESLEGNESKLTVEDPRALEKVILHLVTNLPSPKPENVSPLPDKGDSSTLPLAIIPPKKERIISAIDKIYNVINIFTKDNGLSPTKYQKMDYKNTNSDYKPGEDEMQNRVDCETDAPEHIEEKELSHRQLDEITKFEPLNVTSRNIESEGRLYRFFLSRNRPMDPSKSPPPVTTQSGVANSPVPVSNTRSQSQVKDNRNDSLVINVPSSNEQPVSAEVEPIPGPSGIKRRSHEQNKRRDEQKKIRKTPTSKSNALKRVDKVHTSTTTSTSWVEVRTIPTITQTLVSLIVPVAVYPSASVSTSITQLDLQHEPLLLQVQPVPQIVLQALAPLMSPSTTENQLDAAETPEQALKDLGEFPVENINEQEPEQAVVAEESNADDILNGLSPEGLEAIDKAAINVRIKDFASIDESELPLLLK